MSFWHIGYMKMIRFFQNGFKLTARCGEKIGNKIFHDPPAAIYTTDVWLYQW